MSSPDYQPDQARGDQRNRSRFRRDQGHRLIGYNFMPRRGRVQLIPEKILTRVRTRRAARVVNLSGQARLSNIAEPIVAGSATIVSSSS